MLLRMAIIDTPNYLPFPEGDPDNYKPGSSMWPVMDPVSPDGNYVKDLVVSFERLASGEGVPLHIHTTEELLIVDEGEVEAHLGDERRVVGPGAVIFVPSGTPHGFRNLSGGVVRLHAVVGRHIVGTQMLDRLPRPGTEGQPPQPARIDDFRKFINAL